MKKRITLALLVFLVTFSVAVAQEGAGQSGIDLRARYEQGFLWVVSHTIQFSNSGTEIDYVTQAGQDNLFAVNRFSLDAYIGDRNIVTLLYQPLDLATTALLSDAISVDELTYPAGTAVDFLYSFPFYRVSWMYDLDDRPASEFGIGLSLQIRNARIEFESTDGELFRANRDIGPVPVLKTRVRTPITGPFWVGFEADGFYAPVSYLNGSTNEVVGAILDASVRAGMELRGGSETFLNLRYLAGGSIGTSDSSGPGDGYASNWLHFVTVSAGFSLDLIN